MSATKGDIMHACLKMHMEVDEHMSAAHLRSDRLRRCQPQHNAQILGHKDEVRHTETQLHHKIKTNVSMTPTQQVNLCDALLLSACLDCGTHKGKFVQRNVAYMGAAVGACKPLLQIKINIMW